MPVAARESPASAAGWSGDGGGDVLVEDGGSGVA